MNQSVPIGVIQITQRKLKRWRQIPEMVLEIQNGTILPPVSLLRFDDGLIQLQDGHHRLLAYWLNGQHVLESNEFFMDDVADELQRPGCGNIQTLLKIYQELQDKNS